VERAQGLLQKKNEKKKLDKAMSELREALRLDPKSADAHHALGFVLLLEGEAKQAIAEYREALHLKPDYPGAIHNQLATALAANGDLDGAIAEMREALRLKPDDAVAHTNLGSYFRDEERLG